MLLGIIGDDFTGSSDIGNMLAKGGMCTVQFVGIPDVPAGDDVEAGVVALKSRSIPARDAVAQSLAALEWLRAQGCRQFFFKYCSTFDSTPEGNIGPVGEALAEALGAAGVLSCPAFPATGRSVYQGHLFVGDRLLSESGMEHHPLTPMTDPDLRRWLALQTKTAVGHVPASAVWAGADAVRERAAAEAARGCRLVIADAVRDEDLFTLGRAAADHVLLTGGSGIALGLPDNFRRQGLLSARGDAWHPQKEGRAAVVSGSCSQATRRQVAVHAAQAPALQVSADALMSGEMTAEAAADWALRQDGLPLIYSSSDPEAVADAQKRFGRAELASTIEDFFATVARILVDGGVTRLITAGGETSGAVVEALGLDQLAIGPEIDPGVPALRATDTLTLALKSGNFGADDFFSKADAILAGTMR
ncbi:MAG: four-carbon acid sugar kinase family protein [Rhodobiaceae bacterium]|nr:four-carbon acid sugar kinase family protein [Rhodobiaceae bacterium]